MKIAVIIASAVLFVFCIAAVFVIHLKLKTSKKEFNLPFPWMIKNDSKVSQTRLEKWAKSLFSIEFWHNLNSDKIQRNKLSQAISFTCNRLKFFGLGIDKFDSTKCVLIKKVLIVCACILAVSCGVSFFKAEIAAIITLMVFFTLCAIAVFIIVSNSKASQKTLLWIVENNHKNSNLFSTKNLKEFFNKLRSGEKYTLIKVFAPCSFILAVSFGLVFIEAKIVIVSTLAVLFVLCLVAIFIINAKLKDGKKRIEDGERQLADGREKIKDGEKQLADGRVKVADGERQVADGRRRVADGERQLKEGWKKYNENKDRIIAKIINFFNDCLDDGLHKLQDGEARLKAGKAKLKDGEAQLAVGKAKLKDGEARLREGKARLKAGEAELKAGKERYAKGVLAKNVLIVCACVLAVSFGVVVISEFIERQQMKIIAVGVSAVLFVACAVAIFVINAKLKAGKAKLQSGWEKYRKNDKWFARFFFGYRLEQGLRDLNAGEAKYAKWLLIKKVLIICACGLAMGFGVGLFGILNF